MEADQTSGERGEGRVVGIICRTAWRFRKRPGFIGWPSLWMFDAPRTWQICRHYLRRRCAECRADRAKLAKGQKPPNAIFNYCAETKNGQVSLTRSQILSLPDPVAVKPTSSCVPATRLPLFERRIETFRLSVPQSHQRQLGKTPTSLARRRCRWRSTICRDNNSRSSCPCSSTGARDTRHLNCRMPVLTRSKACWPPERGKGRPLPRRPSRCPMAGSQAKVC